MGRLKMNDGKLKHLCTRAGMCKWKVVMIWSALNQGEYCRAAQTSGLLSFLIRRCSASKVRWVAIRTRVSEEYC